MRVGILTLMHGYNYGGVLQCYSLCKTLEDLGHDPVVLNYHPRVAWRRFRRGTSLLGQRLQRRVESAACALKYGAEIHRHFDTFRGFHLPLSRAINSLPELTAFASSLDAIVVGSDQVWNLNWRIPEYFLSFAQDFRGVKASYAACCGNTVASPGVDATVGDWLRRFDAISVRNAASHSAVSTLAGRASEISCDPTLLVDFDMLSGTSDNASRSRPSPYVLLYAMSQPRLVGIAEQLDIVRTRLDMPIVAIHSSVLQPWRILQTNEMVADPSVERWLSLFREASLIITDSFHGMLTAIKYRVPFVNYLLREPPSGRVSYVADRYNVSRRVTDNFEALDLLAMDFSPARAAIDEHKQQSLRYLSTVLN